MGKILQESIKIPEAKHLGEREKEERNSSCIHFCNMCIE
jgi:hypothetical protein